MTEFQVGKHYTTETCELRCVSRFALVKGKTGQEGQFKEEPKYGYGMKILKAPVKDWEGIEVRYFHNGVPVNNKFETGKITGELNG